MPNNPLHWIWLSLALGPANKAAEPLLDAFDCSADRLYDASAEELGSVGDLHRDTVAALLDKDLTEAHAILTYCEQNGVSLITPDSEYYPDRLYRIRPKPVLLYCLGTLPALDHSVCIAVVGTRSMSSYGERCAYTIGYDLARGGAVVVSGMALGIDARAQWGALEAGGKTVAVLGCGIDRIYPSENRELWHYILENGAVLTEYRPGTPPIGANFPIRNRIISGLCQGTCVVEADKASGAMITARRALYQGRDIFALPGKVGEFRSQGTNSLIQEGAKMITGAADILKEYADLYPDSIHMERLSAFRSPKSGSIMNRLTSAFKYSAPIPGVKTNAAAASAAIRAKVSLSADITDEPEDPPAFSQPRPYRDANADEREHRPRRSRDSESAPPKPTPVTHDLSMLSDDERRVYDAIPADRPVTYDDIAAKGIPIGTVTAAITMLEINALIEAQPGGTFRRL